MVIKKGVKMKYLSPQILLAIMVARELYAKRATEMVITSITDGIHSQKSLHYSGNAVDLRVWNLPDYTVTAPILASQLQDQLGADFDVIFEGDHIHVEFDPK